MTPLEHRMHDLNAALARHDLLVESPGPEYPFFHLYLRTPIPVSELLMFLLLDEQGELTAQNMATLDHTAKTFLRIIAMNACADDILDWARDAGHINATLPAAAGGGDNLSSAPSDQEPDMPTEYRIEMVDEDAANGQWSSATMWESILRPCARCERDFRNDEYEAQERLDISFRAGYGSVFGDEFVVRGSFCQHCVKDVLGSWLEVIKDDDHHRHVVAKPKAAYQPYQIKPVKPDN